MKKRKGFTLIELMIVIAIIIILAAIAIPNYLRMTDRARRSRVAGDFTSIATALEAFSVDWGEYPLDVAAEEFGKVADGAAITSHIGLELTGQSAAAPEQNIPTNKTLTGEDGGIDYIKAETVGAMYNPFDPNTGYYYVSSPTQNHWVLAVQYNTTDILWRSDGSTDLTQVAAATTVAGVVISDLGVVTP
jgi:prepilin-type N-terminal cleavage/methylation domain-containing protein